MVFLGPARNQNAEVVGDYAGINCFSLKMETSLKRKNLLPEGVNSFL